MREPAGGFKEVPKLSAYQLQCSASWRGAGHTDKSDSQQAVMVCGVGGWGARQGHCGAQSLHWVGVG